MNSTNEEAEKIIVDVLSQRLSTMTIPINHSTPLATMTRDSSTIITTTIDDVVVYLEDLLMNFHCVESEP